MKSNVFFYLCTLLIVGLGIFAVLHFGADLPVPARTGLEAKEESTKAKPAASSGITAGSSTFSAVMDGLRVNANEPVSRLLVQLLVVLVAARLAGVVFTRFGQPAVVGEMAAGILLGPSLFGWLSPDVYQFVFPATSLGTLKMLSQIGVCLFLFSVGMEVDTGHVRKKAHTAVMVSHASMVIPFFLGVLLAYFIYTSLAQPGTTFNAFALFMGISMSVTAFPVLARILQERRLTNTFLGSTAITCAAVDDVTAWSVLAFIVAIVRATSMAASIVNLVLVAAFISFMILMVRPALPRLIGIRNLEFEDPPKGVLAFVICLVMAAALVTEIIGIHALFGAFLAGAIMPDAGGFRKKLAVRVENFSSVFLLPLFFAFVGLRTQINLLNDWQGWLLCLGIIAVATLGKLGGSAIAARWTGMSWSHSLQLGALMNTRGLMELIVLNMGYDLGILSPRIFTMMVIMALVTTMMTGPLLTLFGSRQPALGREVVPA